MTSDAKAMTDAGETLQMASDIIAAYVSNNTLPVDKLSGAITLVHQTLLGIQSPDRKPLENTQKPAVSVGRSVKPDYIICLEDGRKFKMLKRHLRTCYDMSPDEYRVKWGLPPEYPMVAPNYSTQRSNFARSIGLGQKSTGRKKKKE
jgi:predicted transcriptional regulator